MALDHLLDDLRRRAESELAAIRDRAAAEAAAITAESDQRVAALRRQALDARESSLRAEASRAIAAAARSARRVELEAEQRLLERVCASAAERLPAHAVTPAGRAVLVRWLRYAVEYLGGRPGTLRCAAPLVSGLTGGIAGNAALTVQVDEGVSTGFQIESADGRLLIDGTLEGALARNRARLAPIVFLALRNGKAAA